MIHMNFRGDRHPPYYETTRMRSFKLVVNPCRRIRFGVPSIQDCPELSMFA